MNPVSKYKSMSVPVKAALWYTVCNFFQKGISFVVVPIYVRLLTTSEYGEWSVFQSWRDILIIFASLNLYCGVYTKTLVDIKEEERSRYTSSMQGLGTLITVVFFLIYIVFRGSAEKLFGLDTVSMLFLFLYFITFPAFQFWSTRQRVEYKYRKMVIATVMISILTPGISIALLKSTNLRANALIYGYLIVQCGFGLIFYIYHFIANQSFYDKKFWSYALKFNIPLIPHYLSLIVLGQADRIMIKNICGDSDAGVYSFAYQIASAINVLVSAINGARVPWTYEQLRNGIYEQLKKISNLLCVLMGGIVVAVSLLSPDVIRILGTAEYSAATYVIPVVTMGVYFTFVYDMFCGVEFYYGATKYVMLASCMGAVLNIILNAIFIPIFGFIAAAYTTNICYFVFMMMHLYFMKKVSKEQKITESIYDLKTMFILSAVTVLISFGCMMTFRNDIVRYALIAVLVCLVIWQRKRLIGLLKQIKK